MPGPYSCGAFVLQERFLHAKLICLGVRRGWFGKSHVPGPRRAAPSLGAAGRRVAGGLRSGGTQQQGAGTGCTVGYRGSTLGINSWRAEMLPALGCRSPSPGPSSARS